MVNEHNSITIYLKNKYLNLESPMNTNLFMPLKYFTYLKQVSMSLRTKIEASIETIMRTNESLMFAVVIVIKGTYILL